MPRASPKQASRPPLTRERILRSALELADTDGIDALKTRDHEQHVTEGPHRDVSAFEVGLELVLEGLREMQRTARSA